MATEQREPKRRGEKIGRIIPLLLSIKMKTPPERVFFWLTQTENGMIRSVPVLFACFPGGRFPGFAGRSLPKEP